METTLCIQNSLSTCVDVDELNQWLTDPHFVQVKKDAEGKDLVLFLGLTGSGKSTCIRYLLGESFQRVRKRGGQMRAEPIVTSTAEETSKKLPKIGVNTYQSYTLHAEIYDDPI